MMVKKLEIVIEVQLKDGINWVEKVRDGLNMFCGKRNDVIVILVCIYVAVLLIIYACISFYYS